MSETTKVPLLDLTAQYRPLEQEIQAVIARVCRSQQFVLGPEVSDFEAEVSTYCAVEHAIGVSSGTDALLLALMANGVGRGDMVLTSAFSFFATAGVIARLGATPVFCDIDPDTFNLDPAGVARFLAEQCVTTDRFCLHRESGLRVRALMPVHLFGQLASMQELRSLAAGAGLTVIEDAAQAIGAEDAAGRRAGSLGDIGCFSFFPTKNLGAFGDAGMCVTNDADLAHSMRIMRVHGGEPKYYHSVIGGNFRLDALQAAVLRIKLRHLDAWTAARQNNAAHYDELLADPVVADHVVRPRRLAGERHTYNQYVIRVQARDELRAWLSERGIGSEIYYPLGLHQQPCFAYLGYKDSELPATTAAAREVLALPVYPELTTDQVAAVAAGIRSFFSARK